MKRILVADDNRSLRQALTETLRRAGYEVLAAEDGAAAVTLYREQAFDLVIVDLIMPEKEGLETIMELRQLQPALKIIAMSGGGLREADDYLPIARHLGAAKTLSKPFAPEEMLEAVANLIGQSG
jgi:CheY-like chemotaxis protein